MTFSKLKTMKKDRGFTIVELLIVIVIIAILAAIVIVAYNGITNRAKSSSALSNAQAVQQKAEAYNAELGSYPAALTNITGATSDKSYYMEAGKVTVGTPASTADPNVISWAPCPATGTQTGVKIGYYKYDGTPGVQYLYAGTSC